MQHFSQPQWYETRKLEIRKLEKSIMCKLNIFEQPQHQGSNQKGNLKYI